jgi:DNA polymerase-3 subunit delta'
MDRELSYTIDITFQPAVVRLLTNALRSGRLHSAYLFTGDDGYGKWFTAVEFAAGILCHTCRSKSESNTCAARVRKLIHPDLHLLFPMPSPKNKSEEAEFPEFFRQAKIDDPHSPVEYGRVANILLDNVRAVKRVLYTTPAEGGYRVAIFHQVERMPDTSFDIMLKTIEEPPPDTVLILTTSNVNRLPATVISRCQRVRFLPVPESSIREYLTDAKGVQQEQAEQFARLSGGSFTEAFRLVGSNIQQKREIAVNLLGVFTASGKAEAFSALTDGVNLRNRDEALEYIQIWTSLLRDVMIFKLDLSESYAFNDDYESELRKIASNIGSERAVHLAMSELLETRKLFYRNVSSRLSLTRLAWRLNQIACDRISSRPTIS